MPNAAVVRGGKAASPVMAPLRQRRCGMTEGDSHHVKGLQSAGWKCAACGMLITRIEDGWVEWLATENTKGATISRGLRLVHRLATTSGPSRGTDCRYDSRSEFRKDKSIVEGLPLERFVGLDGLTLLLAFLAEDELPKEDVLELAKRVQIPGYEQTRELFQEVISRGTVAPVIRRGYYLQFEIQALFKWVRQRIEPDED
ncbi:MAG: hypothetical protein WCA27_31280 [Candidatus Sulfotelmatobacter sp.]